jgi:hypothetical protein
VIPFDSAWAWIVAGIAVSAYGILGYLVDVFRPAIDRAAKPKQEEF